VAGEITAFIRFKTWDTENMKSIPAGNNNFSVRSLPIKMDKNFQYG
jgi:hypothetical protein